MSFFGLFQSTLDFVVILHKSILAVPAGIVMELLVVIENQQMTKYQHWPCSYLLSTSMLSTSMFTEDEQSDQQITSVICGITNVFCGITSVGITSVICGITSVICGITSVICGITSVICGITSVICGIPSINVTSEIQIVHNIHTFAIVMKNYINMPLR